MNLPKIILTSLVLKIRIFKQRYVYQEFFTEVFNVVILNKQFNIEHKQNEKRQTNSQRTEFLKLDLIVNVEGFTDR